MTTTTADVLRHKSHEELGQMLQSGKISIKEFSAELSRRESEKPVRSLRVSFGKDSSKSTVCLYGLNARFPVALYANQWERVFAPETQAMVREFIRDNAGEIEKRDAKNKK